MNTEEKYIYPLSDSKIYLHESGMLVVCRSASGQKKPGNIGKAGKELGKRKKSFELNNKKKRIIRNSAIRQSLIKKYQIVFLTLTFPGRISQKYANECFSKFIENLTTNYKLNSYVSVKENHKSGVPHFHCLLDIPFINFSTINRAWNSTYRGRLKFSPNAVTTGRDRIIKNVDKAAKYISKYISKAEKSTDYDKLIETRLYFISENVLSTPARINEGTMEYLLHINKFTLQKIERSEFIVYFFKDFFCLPEDFAPKKPPPKPEKKELKNDFIQCNFNF